MRYQRQIVLSEIGQLGQEILRSARVLVVGAGGLGHPAIQYLSRMGVGTIGVVDGDVVDESNLHRQVLFDPDDIGKNKALVIEEKFKAKREPARIVPYSFYLDKKLALEIMPGYDLVLDGTDNFESKLLINDVCCLLDKPMVYGSISQFEGHVSVFWKRHGPCYRCLVKDKPSSNIRNCADAGVVGALPGIIGAIQAMEALKLLLMSETQNQFRPLIGCLQVFDFSGNESLKLSLPIRSNCLCRKAYTDVADIDDFRLPVCSAPLKSELIDVREPDELSEFSVEGVLHWPLSRMLNGDLPSIPRDGKITTICKSGVRAERASEILRSNGFLKASYTKESIYGYQSGQK